MPGQTNLSELLKTMRPKLNEGEYVFCTTASTQTIHPTHIIGSFKEEEGLTIIVERGVADELNLTYSYVSSWITLTVHSSLEAVGLTAAFSNALHWPRKVSAATWLQRIITTIFLWIRRMRIKQ